MRAALPFHIVLSNEPDVRFIDQRGRLQRMTPALATHVGRSEFMQFSIDNSKQVGAGLLVACAQLAQQPGDVPR
jgi:hypothetical protein